MGYLDLYWSGEFCDPKYDLPQLVGVNSGGTSLGGDLTFTTSLAAPFVTTLTATGVTATNATLRGTVNPNGAATATYFQYGLTTNYGTFSTTNILLTTNINLSVSNLIGGLASGTTYHYRLVASNSLGTSVGSDSTLTNSPSAPVVTTLAASVVTATNAALNGIVNPNGASTRTYFQYGLTTNYGSFTTTNNLAATNSLFSISNTIGGLAPGSTYHYQLVASNSLGANHGGDLMFTSAIAAPGVTTLATPGVTATNATLNGTINPGGGITTAYFQYGLTTNYGSFSSTNSLVATNSNLSISNLISTLSPGTTYHYQLVGANISGTNLGGDLTFNTSPFAPIITTLAAIGVTATNATLNGTVNPGNGTTSAYFKYGLTTNYGNIGEFTSLPATNTTLAMPGFVASSLADYAGGLWTQTNILGKNWYSIAVSADAKQQAAVAYGGGIWTSTNSGRTWAQTSAPSASWEAIALSADGTHLAAVVNSGGIWTSTDSGTTWLQTSAPVKAWRIITSSANGTRLAAVVNGGGIWTSADTGVTWIQTSAPSTSWEAISSTADGAQLAAVVNGGGIWTSTNSGGTWTQVSAPVKSWWSITLSADGTHLAAVVYGGGIWTSTNSGVTWTQTSALIANWLSITMSADGTHLAAVPFIGGIWTSANSGGSWSQASVPVKFWRSIVSSTYGTQLAAVESGGGIWTSTGNLNAIAPGTTYHYQLVGINSGGIGLGGDLTFTTSPAAPFVTTVASTGITATNCMVNGSVNPNGADTTAYFQYGLTTNYGSLGSITNLSGTNIVLSVSNLLNNLSPRTTYHYELVASNSVGTTFGSDLTFSTSLYQPVAFSLTGLGKVPGGAFQLSFTNLSGLGFTVLGTTNPALALTNWTVIGPAVEAPVGSGNYQFTDTQNTNQSTQYYRVRSP